MKTGLLARVFLGLALALTFCRVPLSQEKITPEVAPPVVEVQGEVGGVWNEANSPYIVVGDIVVPAEGTLVVEPGTTVKFAGYYKFRVEGKLKASGDNDRKITFTSGKDSPGPGDWAGIELAGSSSGEAISRCVVSFAHIAISLDGSGPVTIAENEIFKSRASGIICEKVNSSVLIEGNKIYGCVDGIVCREEASPKISGNTVIDNSGVGILCKNSSRPMIEANFLSRNRSSGITCNFDSDPSVVRNVIAGNGNGMSCTESSPSVIRCDILENEFSGIVCFKLSSPSISESNIWGNGLFEIKNSGADPVTARGNWWGEDTGPKCVPLKIFDSEDDPAKGPVDVSDPLIGPSLKTPGQPEFVSSMALFSDEEGSSPLVDKVSEGREIWIFLEGTDGNPYVADKISLTVRRSITDPSGKKVILTEYGPSTGVFTALLIPYREAKQEEKYLKVINGEVISFSCDLDPSKEISIKFVSLSPTVENLLVQNESGVVRVQVTSPSFSWQYSDPEGDPPEQFQIELGTDPEWLQPPLWQLSLSGDTFEANYEAELERGKDHYVRVRAHDGFGWGEWTVASFRVNAIPPVPVLISPPNGAMVTETLRPRLTVRNPVDVDGDKLSYQFQAFYDSAMTKLALESDGLIPESEGETYWRRMRQLLENTKYYWRVRGYDGYAYSDWSGLSNFSINTYNERAYPFSLVSPKDNEVITNLRPKFDWEDTMDPDPEEDINYVLTYSTDPDFKGATVVEGIPGSISDFVPEADLSDNTVYYWKVAALLDGQVQVRSNETWSFFVNLFNDPPSISEISPISIDEDSKYSFDLNEYASDPDHRLEELSWEVSAYPDIAAEVSGSILELTPSKDWNGGPEGFTVTATDPLGDSGSGSFTVTVRPVNDPPVAEAIPDVVVEEDTLYELNLNDYVGDVDNSKEELTWTADASANFNVEIEGGIVRINGVLNWNGGPEQIAFTVSDPEGGSDNTGASVKVLPVNDPPELSEIPPVVFEEDETASLRLDDYVSDPDNPKSELVWVASQDPNLKTRIDPASHVASFSSPLNWNGGPVNIGFSASDPDGLKDEVRVDVTVLPVNDPPELSEIPGAKFDEDTKFSFDLDDYVGDVDNSLEELNWSASGNKEISVEIDPESHVATLSAPHNWYGGPETITYQVVDPAGTGDSASAQFEVLSVVEPPVLSKIPDTSFREDETTSIALDDYLSDPDHDNSELKISVTSSPDVSAELDETTRVVTFRAPKDWNGGPELIALSVTDPDGASAQGKVNVTVSPVNDPPVLEDIPPIAFDEDGTFSLDLQQYVNDVDDTKFSWTHSGEVNIKVKLDPSSGALTLSAPKDWNGGPEIISFTVSDNSGASDSKDVELTVLPVNDPPVALKIPDVKFDEDTNFTLDLDSYVEDIDNAKDELSWSASGGANVSVKITPERQAVISASADWNGGPEVITFKVTDLDGASAEGKVNVTVSPVNDPPVVLQVPDVKFDEDTSFTLDLDSYVEDIDNAKDKLSWSASGGANVSVKITPGRQAAVSASANWNGGPEVVTLSVVDPSGASAEGKVNVIVSPVNDPPVALKMPDVKFDEDTSFTLDLDPYVEDIDNAKDELSWSASGGTNVSVSITPGRQAVISASADWNGGPEAITFKVTDLDGASAEGKVNVTVSPVNDPPVLGDIPPITFDEDGSALLKLREYVNDVDDNTFFWKVEPVGKIVAELDGVSEAITFKAPPDWYGGPEEVNVMVRDPSGASAAGIVEITVRPVNDPPVLSKTPEEIAFDEDSGTDLDLADYVSDIDNDISELSWSFSGGKELKVSVSGSRFSFSAPENWNGQERLKLTVRDPAGGEATSTVKITVRPVNDPVSIASYSPEGGVSIPEGEKVALEVKASDPDGDVIGYSWTVNGSKVPEKGSSYTYEAAPGSAGSEVSITVTVSDGKTSDSVSWPVRVEALPEQPPE